MLIIKAKKFNAAKIGKKMKGCTRKLQTPPERTGRLANSAKTAN